MAMRAAAMLVPNNQKTPAIAYDASGVTKSNTSR
jgi:hypothetical protein